jgi:ABC-type sugar transport system ATPase subunit
VVELASALAHDAKVWIFDETTAPLTPKEVAELFEVIKKLRDQHCAIVMVTHHLEEVFAIADSITVLRDGKKVAELKTSETSHAEIVKLMVGRDLEHSRLHGATAGKEVLELTGFSGEGFDDVDLKVCKGEIVGLAGLVGAGRTELVRAVFGASTATSGEMRLEGKETKVRSPREARKRGIALVPEDRIQDGLLMPQSIAFNATLADLPEVSSTGLLKSRQIETRTMEYAERLSLSHRSVRQPVAELSGGNQQKVVLSKWLMTKPKLLILDEPTRGVDVGAKREVHKIIRNLADDGLAVLMVSSDLPEVLALCDRTYVMREGRIVAEIRAEDATEEAVMTHAAGATK